MQPSPLVSPVFLLEVVIIMVVEGMRLVATKKLRKVWRTQCGDKKM
jgi:hypothetical protein